MKTTISLIALLVCTATFAQKMKIVNGGFDYLKGQTEVNVEFVYDNMKVMKENFTEAEYIAKRSADLEEKTKGKGTSWEKVWSTSKELIWNPKFLELMNRYFDEDHGITFGENFNDAKYTLIVETVWAYPGWDAGIMKQPAKVTTNLKFVESANRSNVLAEVTSENAPGDQYGNNFSNESRMGEGYAKTAKSLAKLILKEAF
ncbi:MAG: hypothetical protein WBM83_05785 [Flavobacteriaceae bacterium]